MEEAVKRCRYETWEELNRHMSPLNFAKNTDIGKRLSCYRNSVFKGGRIYCLFVHTCLCKQYMMYSAVFHLLHSHVISIA